MIQEKPLVTWKSIANHLGVCVKTAQSTLKQRRVPIFYVGSMVAIFPSKLKAYLEEKTIERNKYPN